ncbi:hypothetical protein [Priestia megaterium]|uniref:hypothetical protein n=1 Tax=Priestia megaterium TaxID=1404 RepID=UPI00300B0784
MKRIIITSATVLVLGLGATAYHYYNEYSALQEKVNKSQYKPVETAADHVITKKTDKADENKKDEGKLDSEGTKEISKEPNEKDKEVAQKETEPEKVVTTQQEQSQQVNDNKEKTPTVAPDTLKESYKIINIEGDTFYGYSQLYGNTSFKRSNLVEPSIHLKEEDNVGVLLSTEGEPIVDQIGLAEFRELETAEGSIPYSWEEEDAKNAMKDGTATVDYETTENGEVIGDGETIGDEDVVGGGETTEDESTFGEEENMDAP